MLSAFAADEVNIECGTVDDIWVIMESMADVVVACVTVADVPGTISWAPGVKEWC